MLFICVITNSKQIRLNLVVQCYLYDAFSFRTSGNCRGFKQSWACYWLSKQTTVAHPRRLKAFQITNPGHPVIMGRKTFESIVEILGKPLPGRTNIVVTRTPEKEYPGLLPPVHWKPLLL